MSLVMFPYIALSSEKVTDSKAQHPGDLQPAVCLCNFIDLGHCSQMADGFYFSVMTLSYPEETTCVILNLNWAYVCEQVLLWCVSIVENCVLRCLFERLVFCVWSIGVENHRVGERMSGMAECPEAMLIRTPSLFPSHSFFFCFVSLHSSHPSLDDSRSSQIIASFSGIFSHLPTPPLLSPAPSFHVSSLLPVLSNPLSSYAFFSLQFTERRQWGWWVGSMG